MSYSDTLSLIIETSGLTLLEIAERCNTISGETVSASYLSKLRGGKQAPASDQVNDAIARACNADRDMNDRLRFEASVEKIPDHTQAIIRELAHYAQLANLAGLVGGECRVEPDPGDLPEDPLSILQEIRYRLDSSFERCACDGEHSVQAADAQLISFVLKDDSMSPYMPPRTLVTARCMSTDDYHKIPSGQFIVLGTPGNYVVRQLFLVEDRPVLWAGNGRIMPEALGPGHTLVGVVERFTVPMPLLWMENA